MRRPVHPLGSTKGRRATIAVPRSSELQPPEGPEIANDGNIAARPVTLFVVGDARSGTTFLASLLTNHPDIALGPESNFVVSLLSRAESWPVTSDEALERALDLLYGDFKFARDWDVDREALRKCLCASLPLAFADFVREVLAAQFALTRPEARILGLKKGGLYVACASALARQIPGLRMLHIVRDGRAVFNSKLAALHSSRRKPFETNAVSSAKRWSTIVKSFDHFAMRHPTQAFEVAYEALVRNPQAELARIFAWLGVEAAKIDTARQVEYVPDRLQHLHRNIGKPPLPDRIEAWREELRPARLSRFEAVAGPVLVAKGYRLAAKSGPGLWYYAERMQEALRARRDASRRGWEELDDRG